MISKKAQTVFKAVEVIKFKEKMNFDSPRRTKINYIPMLLNLQNTIEKIEIMGRNVYKIVPKESENQANQNDQPWHVVFFHGGGYASESSVNQFLMINKFIKLTGIRVTFVEYPLSPEHHVHHTTLMVYQTYQHLVQEFPEHRFILMGDSAGGGLALVLALMIKESVHAQKTGSLLPKLKQPEKLILYSPWLDVSMTHEAIPEYDTKDLFLNLEALKDVGKRYAHDLSLDDPRVSPIYGDLNDLGHIALFYGTHEVLAPDCEKFSKLEGLSGTRIESYVYEEMQHDFMIMPLPEQDQVLQETYEFIQRSEKI